MRKSAGQAPSRWQAWAPWAGLAVIVVVGAAIRFGYFLNGDPFVDEWATILVARGIWEQGLPLLPSGSFYGHGMLFSYLDALLLALLGWTPVVAQIPSLVAGLLAIPLSYVVGRLLFSTSDVPPPDVEEVRERRWRGEAVGLLAAALLALDPIAIIWAGRARAYTLQQLFVLLAILFLYRRRYLLFALSFVCALFSHAEAALLLPGSVLALLLMDGWVIARRPRVWLAMGLSAAAVGVRLWIHVLMSTDSSRQAPQIATRPAFQPTLDVIAGFKPLLPFFVEPYRILVSVLFLVGLVFAARAMKRRDRTSGYLLLYPLCLVTLALLLTVVGQSWKDPRYLFMLLPAFFILASVAAVDLWIAASERWELPAWLKLASAAALVAVLLLSFLPEALDTTDKLEEGYGPALAYVRQQWESGDTVAGWAVPAIAVELGQIDYFALQIRYEEFIMEKGGTWVDRWVGAPLMDSVEGLNAALDEPGRLWFLTDEFRFRSRYTSEFAQTVWDRMEPVFRYHNAMVFVEQPHAEPAYHRDISASFEEGMDLVGYDLDPAVLQPGDTLTVTLHWQAGDWVDAPYTAFVHIREATGLGVTQADAPPFDGLHPTDHWLPGERLRDQRRLTVPPTTPPGRYRLVVGWYDPVTLDPVPLVGGGDALMLAYVPVGRPKVDEPGMRVDAALDGQVQLVGYDLWRQQDGEWVSLAFSELVSAGERLKVRLVWQALAEMDRDFTAFVHLRDADGVMWGQHDGPPQGGSYPTSFWRQGEPVADEHEFTVADEAAGIGELVAGMYFLETMDRLGDAVVLRQLEVRP